MVDLMPVIGLIGTAELEVEAEHTALWFGAYGMLEHIIGLAANFGEVMRRVQLKCRFEQPLECPRDRGLEAPDTTSRREAAGQRSGHRR